MQKPQEHESAISSLFHILFLALQAQTQKDKEHYYRFALSNSHTAKPFGSFSSLFYKNFHPGAEIGYGKNIRTRKKHQWFAEVNMDYLFHRWVQHNLALSINGGYRHFIARSWGGTVKLGGGYQLSMPSGYVFKITENGLRDEGHVVRSQFMANVGIAAYKKIPSKDIRIFLEYQQKLQAPFIKEYVPLLPYNILLIGLTIPVY